MLVDRFNCPECGAVLKPKVPVPAGRVLKCPGCATLIKVPTPRGEEAEEVEAVEEDVEEVEEVEPFAARGPTRRAATRDEAEEDDRRRGRRGREDDWHRPRRGGRGRRKRSGGLVWVVAGVAGAAALGGVALLLALGGGDNGTVNKDTTHAANEVINRSGFRNNGVVLLPELEAALGPAKPAAQDEVTQILTRCGKLEYLGEQGRQLGVQAWHRWRNKNDVVLVALDAKGRVVVYGDLHIEIHRGGGHFISQFWRTLDPPRAGP